jgi:hypothetical protein
MLSQSGRSRGRTPIDDQIFSFGGSIIEQAKKVLDAANSGDSRYDGPTKKELQKIIDGGTPGLVDTLSDFGLYAWCPYLRVILRSRPSLRLSSPRIDLNDIRIEVTATGELWAKYPWFNCYKWCLEWKKVIKCNKIASITVSPNMKAEAHADCSAQGTKVFVRALFDKLRLDYDILNKIPLEGIANDKLKDQLVFVYDASQLVQTVPILKSRFAVSSISLPPSASGINVAATISRI